jgi:tRNA (Thr-GGU) A37 N-methylase
VLLVEGLDAHDGSPLLDVKPLVPDRYGADDAALPEWWRA